MVIAHGLSLMWLAGLVTSRWWDDLWFGQAFADYLAHRVTGEATRFAGPATTFAVRRKAQAYVADQRPSTHPVAVTALDVQSALLDLDRISYFKGSAALRQLATVVGTDSLRAGLRAYLTRHAYGSATCADFIRTLGDITGTDLLGWARQWLHRRGVNTLRAEITVAHGRITDAVVHQTGAPPRYHILHIGLYGYASHETVRVRVTGARTAVPVLVGRPAGEFVLLNEDDLTYAKTQLDQRSLAALPELLPRLSAVNRAMLWCSLLMAVRDGVLPALRYLDLVTAMVGYESELSILVEVLEHVRDDVAGRYLAPAARPAALGRLAAALRTRLGQAPTGDQNPAGDQNPGGDCDLALVRGLVEVSTDPVELRGWLAGRGLPSGLDLDGDLAWRIRYRLAALGESSAAEIDAALATAPGAHAELMAAKARAARPDPAAKEAAWTAVIGDESLSSYRRCALAEGFWQPDQVKLTEPYVERFFADLPTAARRHGDLALDQLVGWLYPRHSARVDTVRHAEKLLARDGIPAPLRRRVLDATDDLERVVAAREAAWSCG